MTRLRKHSSASDCRRAYEEAPEDARRLLNHTFFDRIFVDDVGVAGVTLTDEVALIMGDEIEERFERELAQPLLSDLGLSKTGLVGQSGHHLNLPGSNLRPLPSQDWCRLIHELYEHLIGRRYGK